MSDGGSPAEKDGGSVSVAPGKPPKKGECTEEGAKSDCYVGAADTAGVGSCHEGSQKCTNGKWGKCTGQVTPKDETCDGKDEDCDGEVDEDLSLGSCTPDGVDPDAPENACKKWHLTCSDGKTACEENTGPLVELCNGEDDDCDGMVDEDAVTSCFTANEGCTQNDDGTWTCQGICQAGNQFCFNGALVGQCLGQISPSTMGERCNLVPAADDDCDGKVDEDCPCNSDNMQQECYTGPNDTAGVGTCKSGMQVCFGGFFGFCQGQVVPGAETCENRGDDNDCDGDRDEVTEGVSCTTGQPGRCAQGTTSCQGDRTVCNQVNQPRNEQCNNADDDCDGNVDEDFDLQNNERMCGSCSTQCTTSQQCCNGGCSNLNADPANCGQCGHSCGSGEVCSAGSCRCSGNATQCGSSCVDIESDNNHCGGCNKPCTGGRTCSGGTCQCGGGTILCDGQCVAPACGGACGCASGQACCGDQCVDTRTSEQHCGGCNSPCADSLSCINSVCGCDVGTRCGNSCVNLNNDAANCSSCGHACAGGETCVSGNCQT